MVSRCFAMIVEFVRLYVLVTDVAPAVIAIVGAVWPRIFLMGYLKWWMHTKARYKRKPCMTKRSQQLMEALSEKTHRLLHGGVDQTVASMSGSIDQTRTMCRSRDPANDGRHLQVGASRMGRPSRECDLTKTSNR